MKKLPSKHQIDDEVIFTIHGSIKISCKVHSVIFSEGKVHYDLRHIGSNILLNDIDSALVKEDKVKLEETVKND